MTKKTKRERFIEAAEELQEVLGIVEEGTNKPVFRDLEDMETDVLAEKLLEAKALLYEEDEISKNTEKVLEYLATAEVAEDEEEDEDEVQDAEVVEETEDEAGDPEEEDPEDEEPAEEPEGLSVNELRGQVEACGKRKELLQIAMGEEFFAPLESKLPDLKSEDALRGAMMKLLDETIGDDEPEEVQEEPEAEEAKPVKEKPKKVKKAKSAPGDKSNKQLVYEAWEAGETDYDKLHAAVNERVKKGTIRSWVNGWKNGRNLPASAK